MKFVVKQDQYYLARLNGHPWWETDLQKALVFTRGEAEAWAETKGGMAVKVDVKEYEDAKEDS